MDTVTLAPTALDLDWLPRDLADRVRRQVAAPMPRGRGRLACRRLSGNLGRTAVDGRPHLVFAAYYPYATVIKRAIALRAAADVHLTFLGCCVREDVEISRWFDEAYEVEDYRELHRVLRAAAPAALHVTVPLGVLGAVALDAARHTRVLLDIVDSAYFQEGDADHPDARLERALLARADGLVHKLPADGLERLFAAYGLERPAWQVHSLPWRPLFRDDLADESPSPRGDGRDGPSPRLVYCGGLMPRRIALERGFGHHVFDPVIEAASAQGLDLTIHVNQNARDMHWEDQQGYVDMTRRLPGFHIQPGVPFHRLPETIAGATFGLLYDNLALTKHKAALFRYNVSSKIFSYFEAGLPVLFYKEFEAMAAMLRRFGLGTDYPIDDLPALSGRVAGADLAGLRAAVRRFRETHELAGTAPALLAAFGVPARPGTVLSPVEEL